MQASPSTQTLAPGRGSSSGCATCGRLRRKLSTGIDTSGICPSQPRLLRDGPHEGGERLAGQMGFTQRSPGDRRSAAQRCVRRSRRTARAQGRCSDALMPIDLGRGPCGLDRLNCSRVLEVVASTEARSACPFWWARRNLDQHRGRCDRPLDEARPRMSQPTSPTAAPRLVDCVTHEHTTQTSQTSQTRSRT